MAVAAWAVNVWLAALALGAAALGVRGAASDIIPTIPTLTSKHVSAAEETGTAFTRAAFYLSLDIGTATGSKNGSAALTTTAYPVFFLVLVAWAVVRLASTARQRSRGEAIGRHANTALTGALAALSIRAHGAGRSIRSRRSGLARAISAHSGLGAGIAVVTEQTI